MSYLLDTHALLWTLFDDTRLSAAAKIILLDDSLDIFASVTNFWEISLKFGIGKLDLQGVAPEDLPSIAERECGIETLPLSVGLVTTFHQLPRTGHKDGFAAPLAENGQNRPWRRLERDVERYRGGGSENICRCPGVEG